MTAPEKFHITITELAIATRQAAERAAAESDDDYHAALLAEAVTAIDSLLGVETPQGTAQEPIEETDDWPDDFSEDFAETLYALGEAARIASIRAKSAAADNAAILLRKMHKILDRLYYREIEDDPTAPQPSYTDRSDTFAEQAAREHHWTQPTHKRGRHH